MLRSGLDLDYWSLLLIGAITIRLMTYSIIAFDPDSGECGVAVQSNWFSVGSLVTFAEPGVGAVATQANVDVGYGPRGLALMRAGRSAPEALAELVPADPLESERQVAMIDIHGGVVAHTGADCFRHCGQEVGHHHSTQANLMRTGEVWGAMSEAYLGSSGPLTGRLLDALDAGEAAGGDLRGRQSAAILVVPASGEAWERVIEVRVEDHPDPLVELRRLVSMHAAYEIAREGDAAARPQRHGRRRGQVHRGLGDLAGPGRAALLGLLRTDPPRRTRPRRRDAPRRPRGRRGLGDAVRPARRLRRPGDRSRPAAWSAPQPAGAGGDTGPT